MHPTPVAARAPRDPGAISEARQLVLVIDPDQSARSVLEVVLTRDGFDVASAASAVQALHQLQVRTPDVVVLEADLGEEDGYSVCAQLRGDPRTARVPVVLLARSGVEDVASLAEVVGVDDYVEKPTFARDVAAMVRLELARRSGATILEFHTAQMPPAHLLRALLAGPRSGRMQLAAGHAEVRFREGRIIDARFDQLWGIDALARALMLTEGRWKMVLEPVLGPPRFHCGLRELVHQIFPRLSRWAAVQQRSVPLDAVLSVSFRRLAQSLRDLPDEINRVVQLFDGVRTVQQVLVDSPWDETLTLQVCTRLYLMGVVGPTGERPAEPLPMPRLFEPRPSEADELVRELFEGMAEIRADLTPAAGLIGDRSWYQPPGGQVPVTTADMEWTSRPLAGAVPAETHLAPELALQLDAFQIKTEIEPRQLSAEERPAARFARGESSSEGAPLEEALAGLGARPSDDELPPSERPTPPSALRVRSPFALPLFGGGAPLEAPAKAPGAAPIVTAPAIAAVRPAQASTEAPTVDELEAAFFSPQAVAAVRTAPAALTVDDAEAAMAPRRNVLLFSAAAAVVVLIAAFAAQMLLTDEAPEAPLPPVLSALMPPPAPMITTISEVVDDAPAASAIDVSEPLADARVFYEAGQYRQAIATLEQVVSDDPRSVAGWLLLALAHYDANEDPAARTAVDTVLTLDPMNARGYILLSVLQWDAGDKDGARASLEKAIEVDPNGPFVTEARALLRRP